MVFTWQEKQCSGHLTFLYRSGSSDLYLWLKDPAPALFVKIPKKCFFSPSFFCLLLFEGTLTSFFTDKKSQNGQEIKGFSYYFCLMIERSGSVYNGSGSGRPQNIWTVLRIRDVYHGSRIRMLTFYPSRIPDPQHCIWILRIRNTVYTPNVPYVVYRTHTCAVSEPCWA